MNIVYLYGNSIDPTKGGIQRVTTVLADYFESKGHSVFYISRMIDGLVLKHVRQNYLPNSEVIICEENKGYLKSFILNNDIDVVINQNGMDPIMSELAYIVNNTKAKLFSCIHNSILSPIQHFETTYAVQGKRYKLDKLLFLTKWKPLKSTLLQFYKFKYASHYRKLCANSEKVILLSDKFKYEISFFNKKNSSLHNVVGLPNPLSFTATIIPDLYEQKKKQIIYVGRVDRRQKKVDLLIDIWEKLHLDHLDWNLKIVGGGDELPIIKKLAADKKLENISFEGFVNPEKYYKESAVFCMTSSYEGFGIVLVEAMQYGVVPFAFDSYRSITDIIDDSQNGFLITPFQIDKYAEKLKEIILNADLRMKIGKAAIEKSKLFSVDEIGDKWLALIENENFEERKS